MGLLIWDNARCLHLQAKFIFVHPCFLGSVGFRCEGKVVDKLKFNPSVKITRDLHISQILSIVFLRYCYSLVGLVRPNTEELISRPFMGL